MMALAMGTEFVPEARAQGGNLTLTPTRVVFEGRQRSAVITLINRGAEPATYRIFFTNQRMAEDGSFHDVEEPLPGEQFSEHLIRYSPRQVALEPGAAQAVRLLVRKPRDLEPGEYRSHLVFRWVPPADIGADIEAEELQEGELRIRLIPVVSLSIPIIVRHTDLSAGLTLSDLALRQPESEDAPPVLFMRFNRSGERSVYGDISVTFTAAGGDKSEIGLVRGLAVYTPNRSRTLELRLRPPEGVRLQRGRLNVVFRESDAQPGAIVAEAEISVP